MGQIKNIKLHIVTDIKVTTTKQKPTRCRCSRTYRIPQPRRRRTSTNSPDLFPHQTPTSWTSSAPDVTKSLQSSHTRRPLSSASVAPLSSVSRLVAAPDSPKDAASERSPVKPSDVTGLRKEAYLVNLVVVIMLETSHK